MRHCRELLKSTPPVTATDISTIGDSQLNSTLTHLPSVAEALTKPQLQELQSLTPKAMYMLTDWSVELGDLPSINDADVKRFLLPTDILIAASERTYKLSRPYQLKQFGNADQVCSVLSFYVTRARCLSSRSMDKDKVKLIHVVIDKHTGQPVEAIVHVLQCMYVTLREVEVLREHLHRTFLDPDPRSSAD